MILQDRRSDPRRIQVAVSDGGGGRIRAARDCVHDGRIPRGIGTQKGVTNEVFTRGVVPWRKRGDMGVALRNVKGSLDSVAVGTTENT
jgi:hypothetical protein